jgi:hypothetical protein
VDDDTTEEARRIKRIRDLLERAGELIDESAEQRRRLEARSAEVDPRPEKPRRKRAGRSGKP